MKLNFILPEESTDLATGWHARTHTHTHRHTYTHTKRCKSDRATSTWYTLGNANAGGAVTFKPYNSKSI